MRYQLIPLTEEFRKRKIFVLGNINNPNTYKVNIDVSSLTTNHILDIIGVYINGILYNEEISYSNGCLTINNIELDNINYEIALLCTTNVKNRLSSEIKSVLVNSFSVSNYKLTINDNLPSKNILGLFINNVLYSTPSEIDLTTFNTNKYVTMKHLKPISSDKIAVLLKI